MSKPDPHDLPAPHQWGTYITGRHPKFKTHSTLGTAKNAISGKFTRLNRQDVALWDSWVYEWVNDEDGSRWVERWEILKGDPKDTHPLWKFKASNQKPVAVSQKAMDKAITSILSAVQE